MSVTGLAYSVSRMPVTSSGPGTFRISTIYVQSSGTNEAIVRFPADWIFPLPTAEGLAVERFGASETKGLLGGVKNPTLMQQSETVERAIGDVLTLMLCEIMDREPDPQSVRLLILGPAFPKVVGRFASLRPPRSVQILWMAPRPFPAWIIEGINEMALFPRYQPMTPSTEAWEEEPMIRGCEFSPTGNSFRCAVQQLQLGDVGPFADLHQFDWTALSLDGCPPDVLLPREIVAAAGQLQTHLERSYRPGDDLRAIKEHAALYSLPDAANPPRAKEEILFGWGITWL